MTDAALALDFSNEGMTVDPVSAAYRPAAPANAWLARRGFAWGGSELAGLMLAYDLAPITASPPAWLRESAEQYQALGLPKILAWKSGLRAIPKGDEESKDRGNELERKLLHRWRDTMCSHRVDPKSVRHSSSVPREWFPLIDRHCVRIAVTPDAWARAVRDRLLTIVSVKTTRNPLVVGIGTLWHYEQQLQAEIAACAAEYGIIVVGEGWQYPEEDFGKYVKPRIRAFAVRPDPEAVALQRALANEAWSLVEALRLVPEGKGSAKRVKELWAASKQRMAPMRDPHRVEIESALEQIDDLEQILVRQAV